MIKFMRHPSLDRLAAAAIAASLLACNSGSLEAPDPGFDRAVPPPPSPGVRFVDVTDSAGIDFHHRSGRSGRKYGVETIGSGAAFFDYDDDGRVDLYVVNGADLPGHVSAAPPRNELYHSDGEGRFSKVGLQQGVADTIYGMGCTVGDYDNDGDDDLFVTNFGPNVLYRNEGASQQWRFEDVSVRVGVARDSSWSTGCAFADYDLDGDLDLYVANYLAYNLEDDALGDNGSLRRPRRHLAPTEFPGRRDYLFRNDEGRFVDVTAAADLESVSSRELGVVFLDYDGDGDFDLFQGNDATPNFLFRNDGTGSFSEVALTAGVAYNESGRPEGTMGVDAADVDGDGHIDLAMTNFQWESNTLYRNLGNGRFADVSRVSGIAATSFNRLGFGINLFDVDLDGDKDMFVANGHIDEDISRFDPDATYGQQDQLLLNDGSGVFTEITHVAGPGFEHQLVGRGSATADYDDDGDLDLFVVNTNQPAVLLRNDTTLQNHWVALRLRGTRSNRNGYGARVVVWSGELVQVDETRSGSSYLSQDDPRLYFGLGPNRSVDRVEITWPSGTRQVLSHLSADRVLEIFEPVEVERHDTDLAGGQPDAGSGIAPAPGVGKAAARTVERAWMASPMVVPNPVLRQPSGGTVTKDHSTLRTNPSETARNLQLAGALRDRGDLPGAESHYRKAISLDPNLAAAWTGLGQTYGRHGDLEAARAAFVEAVRADSTTGSPHYELGNLLARQQLFDQAVPHYQRAIARAPEHINAHINLAGLYTRQTDYGPARVVLERAIRLHPQDGDLRYRLGRICFLQARYRDAMAMLNEAIHLRPGLIEAYDLIAQIHLLEGDLAAAHLAVAAGLRVDTTAAPLHTRMGALLFSQGEYASSVAALKRGIRGNPDDAEAYYLLGHASINLGDNSKGDAYLHCFRRLQDDYTALLACKTAIMLNPDGTEGYYDLGAVYSRLGRYEAARQAYTIALRIHPGHIDALNNLGNIYVRRGQVYAAIETYREVIERAPGYAKAYNNLGYALLLAGDPGRAAAQFEKAIQLEPEYAQARLNLAKVLRRQERAAGAAPPPVSTH